MVVATSDDIIGQGHGGRHERPQRKERPVSARPAVTTIVTTTTQQHIVSRLCSTASITPLASTDPSRRACLVASRIWKSWYACSHDIALPTALPS